MEYKRRLGKEAVIRAMVNKVEIEALV